MTVEANDNPTPWGIRPGMRVWIGGHDRATRRAVERMLSGADRPPAGPLDAAFICPETTDEAVYFADKVAERLVRVGALWIVTPAACPAKAQGDALIPAMAERGYQLDETAHWSDRILARRFRLHRHGSAYDATTQPDGAM